MVFHLAIPSSDLNRDALFYQMIGAEIGRKYPSHIVMNFFNMQLVIHKVMPGEVDQEPKMYPRHFGVIFDEQATFLRKVAEFKNTVPHRYVFQDMMKRNMGKAEEHSTFFLKDPSNNLIEFKWYKNTNALF